MNHLPGKDKRRTKKGAFCQYKKKPPKDTFNTDLDQIANACRVRESFKPLRWQGRPDYMKAIYDPEPE